MNEDVYKEEFSHATLHGQNVFKAAKEKLKNENLEAQIDGQFINDY